MNNQKESKDPLKDDNQEMLFLEAYNDPSNIAQDFKEIKSHFTSTLKSFTLIPESDVIHDCDLFSVPDLPSISLERDSSLFFKLIMSIGELFCTFLVLSNYTTWEIDQDSNKKLEQQIYRFISSELDTDEFKSPRFKPILDLVKAAAYIVLVNLCPQNNDDYDKQESNQFLDGCKTYFNDKTVKFLTEVVIVQKSLCRSKAFKPFLEVVGKIFIVQVVFADSESVRDILTDMFNNEKTNSYENKPTNEFQTYLNFVKTVNNFYDTPELPEMLIDSILFRQASDFGVPAFFCSFVDFLTSMVKSFELAEYIVYYIKESSSEILNFDNFFKAIQGHTEDLLKCEIDRQQLDAKDSLGIESVLRLISALCSYFPPFLKSLFDEYKDYNIVNSLLMHTLSPVPCSFKAECFNCLGTLNVNLWGHIKAAKLLTIEMVNTQKHGIISDIFDIEAPSHMFSVPRGFANMIKSLLANPSFAPDDFIVYHRFMHEIVLNNLTKWSYLYIEMKWGMLQAICDAWISALSRKNYLDICMPIFRSAISDQTFVSKLLDLTNDDACPIECLRSVYSFLLLLLQKEKDFLKKAFTTNEPSSANIANQISRNSNSIIKMLHCLLSHFKDFQIISLKLIEFLSLSLPLIVQLLLTKPSAHAIQIFSHILEFDDYEDLDTDYINVRCLLLDFLFKLGSNSYFLRHVCGFDQHSIPESLLTSTLDSGVFVVLSKKLCEDETHKNFPNFVSKALRVLLLGCKQELTIGSTLNLLRSNQNSFFRSQLWYLSYEHSLPTAIGYFLQILARETINSSQTGSLSGITRDSFNFLMSAQINNKYSKRSVLLLYFIDKINNKDESKPIIKGINNLAISYLNSDSIISFMQENEHAWPLTWIQVVFCLLDKLQTLNNHHLTASIANICILIIHSIFIDKKFGEINSENIGLKKLFTLLLKSINHLMDIEDIHSRTSLYTIISAVVTSLIPSDELIRIYRSFENQILRCALLDMDSEIPILRSSSFTLIESLIPYSTPGLFLSYLDSSILQIESDWKFFENNPKSALFCISLKCKLYSKFITFSKNPFIEYRTILGNGLINRMSYGSFWNKCFEMISNSSEYILHLHTASDILFLFALMSTVFGESEDLRIQIRKFLRDYEKVFSASIDYTGFITLDTIQFFVAFFKLLSTLPKIEDIQDISLWERIPYIFRRFANEDDWRNNLKNKDSTEVFEKAKKLVSQLLMSGIFLLTKMSERKNVFSSPIFGEEWRSKFLVRMNNESLPLSIITSYLIKIMNNTKENNSKERGVISSCLVLIWWHIYRWNSSPGDIDIGSVKEQARAFSQEPFSKFSENSDIDSLILKKLTHISNE